MLENLDADAQRRLGYVPVTGAGLRQRAGVAIEFARWLRSALERADLSIEAAAVSAGLSGTTVAHWAHGDNPPRSEREFRLR